MLRPGGQLLVVGHVASPHRVVRAGQRTLERLSIRLAGDHQTRRHTQKSSLLASPLIDVNASRAGIIERIHAIKPSDL